MMEEKLHWFPHPVKQWRLTGLGAGIAATELRTSPEVRLALPDSCTAANWNFYFTASSAGSAASL